MQIDLSCDLGEASNPAELRVEAAIWPLLTSANVACGGHIGDDESMREAVRCALEQNVALGAHPSYPDRANFGRRPLSIPAPALEESLVEQIASLQRIAAEQGVALSHVKPHGALYNEAQKDKQLAAILVRSVARVGPHLGIVCAPSSRVEEAAYEAGLRVITEAFADRRYRADGSLVPRANPDALILDLHEAAEQALSIVLDKRVATVEGETLEIDVTTLCVHSDTPRAPERLRSIRKKLQAAGIVITRIAL